MRAAVPFSVLSVLVLLLGQPLAGSSSPILPGMRVTLTPSTISVNVTGSQIINVMLNGTVEVSQNTLSSMDVALTAAVDTGWPANCNPSSLQFGGSGTKNFACIVQIPPANLTNASVTGQLTVTAKGQTRFLIVTNYARATIEATGPGNRTANETATSGAGAGEGDEEGKIGGMDLLLIVAVVVVVAVAGGAGGVFILRRRKARRLEMELAPVPEAQPQ